MHLDVIEQLRKSTLALDPHADASMFDHLRLGRVQIDAVNRIRTPAGLTVLRSPGVGLLAVTGLSEQGRDTIHEYLRSYQEAGFAAGADDYYGHDIREDKGSLALTQFSGQLCYQSFTEERTPLNEGERYFQNLISGKPPHGAVLEHVNVSMLVYGISRTVSHEWVRHRAGWGYSQVSQRYVAPKNQRYTIRREVDLHGPERQHFLTSVDAAHDHYVHMVHLLENRLVLEDQGNAEANRVFRRNSRKAVRQAARDQLYNAAETAMVVTGNIRAWRNFLDHRANPAADSAMVETAWRCFLVLRSALPVFFGDYTIRAAKDLYGITRLGVATPNIKV